MWGASARTLQWLAWMHAHATAARTLSLTFWSTKSLLSTASNNGKILLLNSLIIH